MSFDIKPAGHELAYGHAPFPFVIVDGGSAMAAFAELRAAWQDASPVIWGNSEEASRLFELYGEEPANTAETSLAAAKGKSAAELMDDHMAARRASLAAWYAKRGETAPENEEEAPPRGSWPQDIYPHQVPLSLIDLSTGRPKEEVLIGLVPTVRSWEIPAYHGFGDWNACPSPSIHVAIGREWAERYGARLIANTSDVIEFEVDRPISSRAEAIAVAELQFRYCNDIVYQGAQTIEALAASLVGAKYWFFWWD
jgi:hypothetical protein